MKTSKSLKNKIGTIFIIGIVLLTAYVLVFGSIARKKNELLTFFGYSASIVPTGSMDGDYEDSIEPVSIIISKKVSFDSLKIGDVVVFKAPDNSVLIVHRIVRVDEDGYFITKGDNLSNSEDGPLYQNNFQAIVVNSFKVPDFFAYTNTIQLTILFVIMIVLIMLVIYQVFEIIRNIKKAKLEEKRAKHLIDEATLREKVRKELKDEDE